MPILSGFTISCMLIFPWVIMMSGYMVSELDVCPQANISHVLVAIKLP